MNGAELDASSRKAISRTAAVERVQRAMEALERARKEVDGAFQLLSPVEGFAGAYGRMAKLISRIDTERRKLGARLERGGHCALDAFQLEQVLKELGHD